MEKHILPICLQACFPLCLPYKKMVRTLNNYVYFGIPQIAV